MCWWGQILSSLRVGDILHQSNITGPGAATAEECLPNTDSYSPWSEDTWPVDETIVRGERPCKSSDWHPIRMGIQGRVVVM